MTPIPPRAAEKPSIVSVADYFRQGRVRMESALARFPGLDPAMALIKLHQQGDRLRPVTARRYLEDDRRALAAYLRHCKRRDDIEGLTTILTQAIEARGRRRDAAGVPLPALRKRTSALKVLDATDYEARTAFYELKQQALENRNIHTILAALFVLVCNHSGLRPVELVGARMDGTVLTLLNAKVRPGGTRSRSFDLVQLHSDVLDAVRLMIQLIPAFPDHHSYVLFRNRLREALRRACIRGNIRKLSLYSFRHCAIATWTRAGMGAKDIARLAGHASLLTAGRNYAGARVGHDRVALAIPVEDAPVNTSALSVTEAATRTVQQDAASLADSGAAAELVYDDMPVPLRKAKAHSGLPPEELARAKARWAGEGNAQSIAENIARAMARKRESKFREPR